MQSMPIGQAAATHAACREPYGGAEQRAAPQRDSYLTALEAVGYRAVPRLSRIRHASHL